MGFKLLHSWKFHQAQSTLLVRCDSHSPVLISVTSDDLTWPVHSDLEGADKMVASSKLPYEAAGWLGKFRRAGACEVVYGTQCPYGKDEMMQVVSGVWTKMEAEEADSNVISAWVVEGSRMDIEESLSINGWGQEDVPERYQINVYGGVFEWMMSDILLSCDYCVGIQMMVTHYREDLSNLYIMYVCH